MDTENQKKNVNRTKSKSINIRTDEVHFDKFVKLAEQVKLNRNTFVEKIIDEGFGQVLYITAPSLDSTYEKFHKVLVPVANNLNQITKIAHSSGQLSSADIETLTSLTTNINILLKVLQNKDKYIVENVLTKGTNKNGDV